MFNIDEFLNNLANAKVSDIHLIPGKKPALRISGEITWLNTKPLEEQDISDILETIVHRDFRPKLKDLKDIDFTYEVKGVSRYRVNYCKDLGLPKLTLRLIPYEIPTFEQLSLPGAIKEFTKFNNGILLVTGATGSGKSTTIASLVESINKTSKKHIVTIEDPIEFLYSDKNCLISQRGLGVDVEDFPTGVKYAMRQDPDIIVIGEIRDKETVEAAIQAAETGHFVLSTVHTNSVIQTINRMVGLFETDQKEFIRTRLAACLRGTIAQKLIPKIKGGRVPAVEMMTITPAIADYIAKDKMGEIEKLIKKSNSSTICTMNESIYNLFKSGLIDQQTALEASDSPTELHQMIRGIYYGVSNSNTDLI